MELGARRPDGDGLAQRLKQRRVELVVVAALSLAGLGVAVELLRRESSEPSEAAVGPVGFLPKPEAAGLGPGARAEPAYPEAERELSFSRLMDILGAEAAKPEVAPLVEPFKKAFAAQPKLKKTFDEYKRRAAGGEKPSAKAFLSELRKNSEFAKLAHAFGQGPGGSSALLALARQPELKRFMNEQDRALAAAGRPGPGAPAGRTGRMVPVSGGRGASGGGARAAGVASYAGPAGFQPEPAAAGLHGAAPSAPGMEPGGKPGSQSSPGAVAGPGAHAATPLAKDWKDEKTITRIEDKIQKLLERYPCLEPLGAATLERFIAGSSIDTVGLWGACFQLRLYGSCKSTGCGQALSCWQACMDAQDGNTRGCIEKTRQQPGCGKPDVDRDAWTTYCVPRRDARGNCLPGTPIPECGEPPCADNGIPDPADRAAICAALAGQRLAPQADPRFEQAALAEWRADEALRDRFMSGTWQSGSASDLRVSEGRALQRFLLEYTRDQRTEGWRGCDVAEGGYVTGTPNP